MLDVLHGNRVDTGKWLVEHDELRVDGQATGYLRTTALTTRQTVTLVLAHLLQAELCDKALQLVQLLLVGELRHLKHGHDIVLHRQLTEHAGLLRQVANAGTGTLIHREIGDLLVVNIHMSLIGNDEARGHVKRCGLSGTVRTKQSHDLALTHVERHVVGHRAAAVALHQSLRVQHIMLQPNTQQCVYLLVRHSAQVGLSLLLRLEAARIVLFCHILPVL